MTDRYEVLSAAFRGLVASRDLGEVALAMFHLNRHARGEHGMYARGTYRLKDALIRWLYEAGHCVECRLVYQDLPCWHTFAYLEGRADVCYKCGNTGVYRTVELVEFVFLLGDRRFVWHQPRDLIDWPVVVNDGASRILGLIKPNFEEAEQPRSVLAWAVWWWLIRHGVRLTPPLELHGWPPRHWAPRFVWARLQARARRVSRGLRWRVLDLLGVIDAVDEDGIPF
jgi:hypothetical protein